MSDQTPPTVDVDAIRARAEAATGGPWRWRGSRKRGMFLARVVAGQWIVMDFVRQGMSGAQPRFRGEPFMLKGEELAVLEVPYREDVVRLDHPDADFIAHAREDIPALLSALDAVTAERDQARTALRPFADFADALDAVETANPESWGATVNYEQKSTITYADVAAARAALAGDVKETAEPDDLDRHLQDYGERVASLMPALAALADALESGATEMRATLTDPPDDYTVGAIAAQENAARLLRAALGGADTQPTGMTEAETCEYLFGGMEPQPTEPEPDGPTQAHSADDPAPPHSSGEKIFVAPCGRTEAHEEHGATGVRLCGGKLTWERGTRPPCGHDGLCMHRWQNGTFGGVCAALPPEWIDLDARPASDPDTPLDELTQEAQDLGIGYDPDTQEAR